MSRPNNKSLIRNEDEDEVYVGTYRPESPTVRDSNDERPRSPSGAMSLLRKKLKASRNSKNDAQEERPRITERDRYRDQVRLQTTKAIQRSRSRSKSRSRSRSRSKSRTRGGVNKNNSYLNTSSTEVDGRIAEIIGYSKGSSPATKKPHRISYNRQSNSAFYSSADDAQHSSVEESYEYLRQLSGSLSSTDADSHGGLVFSSFDDEVDENHRRSGKGKTSPHRSKKMNPQRMKGSETNDRPHRPHRRYRGFTSSIAALFQDEQIVCGAIACFGLLLSQRTEYLLNARNVRRGVSKKRTPSTHLAYALGLLIISVTFTYAIWGITGIGSDLKENYYDNKNDGYNRKLLMRGFYKGHEWHELIWSNSGLFNIPRLLQNDYYNYEYKESYNDDRYSNYYNGGGEYYNDGYYDDRLNEMTQAASARAFLFIIFLFLLGVVGRRRRMRTRYEIIKARTQDDHLFYVEGELDAIYDTREDKYDAACSHTLFGCYPADPDEFVSVDASDSGSLSMQTPNTLSSPPPDSNEKDFVQKIFNIISLSCCGKIFKCWIQCFSVCALAQEAREARLLVPPKLQRIDYLTHQPFHEYHEQTTNLRRKSNGGVASYIKSLSRLSIYLIIAFILFAFMITMTLLFNPKSSFGIGNLVVVLTTFGISFLLLYILHGLIHRSDLGLDAVIKMFSAGFLIGVPSAFILEGVLINISIAALYVFYGFLNLVKAESFFTFVQTHNRFFWMLSEIIQAYVIAALIEEVCKYYTFRTIEHPDLMFITDDDRVKQIQKTTLSSLYPVTPIGSYDEEDRKLSRKSKNDDKTSQDIIEMMDDEPDERTPTQMAGAITVAMVSVALGLACAENFFYVFFLSDATVMQDFMILCFRSIFPVHALAAALQSVGVIKKYIEKDDDMKVGKIIFPAVMMHGSFDVFLMVLNALEEEPWNYYTDERFRTFYSVPLAVTIMCWLGVIAVIIMGGFYYRNENEKQKLRLMNIEDYFGYNQRTDAHNTEDSKLKNRKAKYAPPPPPPPPSRPSPRSNTPCN